MDTKYRKCQVCGHEWVRRRGSREPNRCPSSRCRSRKWKDGQDGRRGNLSRVGVRAEVLDWE